MLIALLALAACKRADEASNSDPNALDFVPVAALVLDLNNDGRMDVVVVGDGGGSVFLGDPVEGIVPAPGFLPAFKANVKGLGSGDLDGDGKPDLALAVSCDTLYQPEEAAAKDAFLDENDPTAQNGQGFSLVAGTPTTTGSRGEGVLGLDDSLLPAGQTLDKAVLQLFQLGAAYSSDTTLALYENVLAWDENTVSWGQTPCPQPRGAAVATTLAKASTRAVWREFDITAPYSAWRANPAANLGLLLSRIDASGPLPKDVHVGTVMPSSNWANPQHTSGGANQLNPALRPKLALFHRPQGRPARDHFKPLHLVRDASGGFQEQAFPAATSGDWVSSLVADFDNADGDNDVATGADVFEVSATGGHQLHLNDAMGSGVFLSPPKFQPVAAPAAGGLAADLEADGVADVVLHDGKGGVRVWLGSSGGQFTEPADAVKNDNAPGAVRAGTGAGGGGLLLLDTDQDGDLDLLVSSGAGDSIVLLRNLGGGSFDSPAGTGLAGLEAGALASVDLDGDGDLDLAYAAATASGGVAYLRNLGNNTFANMNGPFQPITGIILDIDIADLDGDGKLDQVVVYGGSAPGFNVQFGQ